MIGKETQPLTQLEFSDEDFPKAEAIAKRLGYTDMKTLRTPRPVLNVRQSETLLRLSKLATRFRPSDVVGV